MTGPEHFREAERLIREAHAIPDGFPSDQYAQTIAEATANFSCPHELAYTARAKVHATLALAAATAFSSDTMPKADWDAWRAACATTPAPITEDYTRTGGMPS